jgi:hypothetical protein
MVSPIHQPFLPFLTEELGRLHRARSSGTLFATTISGRLAQFGLDNGEIVFLSFQNVEGLDAVASLREQRVEVGTARFAPGRHRGAVLSLPPTVELLSLLAGGAAGAPLSRAAAAGPSNVIAMSAEVKAIIEEELTEIGGPIAAMLCEEVWEAGIADLGQALTELAKQLPDATQAEQLRRNVLNRLKSST